MGSKRLGLARTQALLQNLKRDLDLSNSNILNGILRRKAGYTADTAAVTQADTTLVVGRNAKGADGTIVNPFAESASAQFPIGSILKYNDRTFRYCKNGGSGLAAGKVTSTRDKSHASNHLNLNCLAAAIGSTTVTIITAGTNIVENEYAGGYLYVNDGTGEGHCYKIKSHPAHTHASSPNCVMTLHDPIVIALVASGTSQVSLAHSKYEKIKVAPGTTPMTGQTVGVPPIAVTADYYFWNQVSGPAAVLVSGTVVIGDSVCHTISGGTAGAVIARVGDSAAQRVARTVGEVMQVNASTEYALIDLTME
jgi:hypothetical protein